MTQHNSYHLASTKPKTALLMAGGTGGHIFPALAVAQGLLAAGWRVHWLGAPNSMEQRVVQAHSDIGFEAVSFSGVRGKGWRTMAALPLTLLRAIWQSTVVLQRVQPNVVLGFGGYISFPAGLVAAATGRCLMLHEQNSIAGSANKWLAKIAKRVFTAFPRVFAHAEYIGNPLRQAFTEQAKPHDRFGKREGPLRLLVLGGSLGAQALNDTIPAALASLDEAVRPVVVHQSGEKHIEALRSAYHQAGVQARCVAFIEDVATEMAEADCIVARAGASTVCEIAAVGAAAHFVPFPYATDDHQTHNAAYLVQQGAAWCTAQSKLSAAYLADWIRQLTRQECALKAEKAHALAQTQAVDYMVQACEAYYGGRYEGMGPLAKQSQSKQVVGQTSQIRNELHTAPDANAGESR